MPDNFKQICATCVNSCSTYPASSRRFCTLSAAGRVIGFIDGSRECVFAPSRWEEHEYDTARREHDARASDRDEGENRRMQR
jgi:hypothetical protein